ncbi:MAG: hypothetical protein B6243_09155 [Anaerolineaceae bacterium 4572_5.2]|nr:MAG: hypothetical protein B6243_09155 [Anaerolineaceae bacterium 4572_5.2]
MNYFYLDASAIIKRYLTEQGSEWVFRLAEYNAENILILGEITLAEVAAALASRRRATNGISDEEYKVALLDFLSHCQSEYQLTPIERSIIDLAVSLTQRHRLRGYDAVQLAAALNASQTLADAGLSPLTFVAADKDLLSAAQLEGMSVENPNER